MSKYIDIHIGYPIEEKLFTPKQTKVDWWNMGAKTKAKILDLLNENVRKDNYPMDREKTLKTALETVTEREQSYGNPEDCFNKIADLWSAYLHYKITPVQVAMMMIMLKIAREDNNHKDDNLVDICGYASCANGIIHNDCIRPKSDL